jgi:hypothetical protein
MRAESHVAFRPPLLLTGREPSRRGYRPQAFVQVPFQQVVPDRQERPQLPQFALSVVNEVHRPAQLIWPAGQLTTQVPPEQVVPPRHEWPQAPQLLGS